MMSSNVQPNTLQMLTSVSVFTFSPRFSLLTVYVLILAAAAKSFFFISLSISYSLRPYRSPSYAQQVDMHYSTLYTSKGGETICKLSESLILFGFIIDVVECTLYFYLWEPRCGNDKSFASSVFVYTKTSSCLLGISPTPKNSPQVVWLRIRFLNA